MSDRDTTPNGRSALSVVFAATHDSQTLRAAVQTHQTALAQLGGELLVADGTEHGLPPEVPTAVHVPGADVFALRAAAAARAQGEVVAFTEDHCLPDPEWHANLVRAHRENPEIAAIGGAVLNGSTLHAWDWANFMMTFGQSLPPLPLRHVDRVAPPANISVKGHVLRNFELTSGQIEMEIMPQLFQTGQLVLDERVRIEHIQSHPLWKFMGHHFHNGRSTAGLPLRPLPRRERLRAALRKLKLPWILVRQVTREVGQKPAYRRDLRRALPFVVLFSCAHAAGEATGVLFGPGASPKRLE